MRATCFHIFDLRSEILNLFILNYEFFFVSLRSE